MRPGVPELERMPVTKRFLPRTPERDLIDALCAISLDLIPYEPQTVAAYKNQMIESSLPYLRRKFSLRTLHWCHHLAFICFVACLAITTLGGAILAFMGEFRNNQWSWGCACSATIGFVILTFVTECARKHTPGTWVRERYADYTKEIPDDVHDTALLVSERIPEGELFVESYMEDPFLVLRYKGRDHHLEVWGEHGFKPTRGS
jgi:hypothetical protein